MKRNKKEKMMTKWQKRERRRNIIFSLLAILVCCWALYKITTVDCSAREYKDFSEIIKYQTEVGVETEIEPEIETETETEMETETETETETEMETETETELETETETEPAYTEDEVSILASLMYAEEGNIDSLYGLDEESYKRAHMYAGSVVLHRMESEKFPDSMCDVIYQVNPDGSHAYAQRTREFVTSGDTNQIPKEIFDWAEELLKYGPIGPERLVFQASFPQGEETYEKIGNQYFCLMA